MNKNIDCHIILDLLPSYIDGLTSEHTNQVIEEHMKHCEPCNQMLERMKEPEKQKESTVKEVDYMKKVQNRMSRLLTVSLISIGFLLVGAVAGILIYNRMTPKSYQEVFENNKADSFEMTHLASGTKFTLDEYEAYEFQKMLEGANYYYEGKEGNVIEGDMFMIFVNISNVPVYELKITENYKIYYDGKIYDFRECKDLWYFLEERVQVEESYQDWEKETYHYLHGEYVMETNESKYMVPSITLYLDEKRFTYTSSFASSYWEEGSFIIDDRTITLDRDGAQDYVFTITEEGVLSYDAENSGPLRALGEATSIPDGTKFIKGNRF